MTNIIKKKFKFEPFANCGVVKGKISPELLIEIKDSCKEIFNNKTLQKEYNQVLAGNIKHEYVAFYNEKFNSFLLNMADFYIEHFNEKNIKFNVVEVWINFQKKYEFNPLHIHNGNFSFVLWVQIPYDLYEEKNNPSSIKSNTNVVSDFYYQEPYGITTISLSKDNEGDIIMFPSTLYHGVYPFFTSDDYRISVAGNLKIINQQDPEGTYD